MAPFGDGLASDADLVVAAEQAVAQARSSLGGARPDLVSVFVCGSEPDEAEVALLRAAEVAGAATTIGATSAAGVIGGGEGVERASAVSVWAGVLPGLRLRSFHLETMRTGDALAVLGLPPRRQDDAVAVLLADPWSFPVDGFVEQSNASLPGLSFVGGLASGPRGAGSTRLLLDGHVVDRGAVGVVLSGPPGRVATLVSQGCRPVGPVMTVTAAENNVLLELAGRPALPKLAQIVEALPPEEQAMVTTGLQLGIAMDEYADEFHTGDFLVRGIVGADEERAALIVGDVVQVGQTVQFQVRDAASARADLVGRLAQLRQHPGAPAPGGALLFSCNGRGAALFGTADHDVAAVRAELGIQGVAGFFAAGEIGPVGGRNHLHAFTASLLLLNT